MIINYLKNFKFFFKKRKKNAIKNLLIFEVIKYLSCKDFFYQGRYFFFNSRKLNSIILMAPFHF